LGFLPRNSHHQHEPKADVSHSVSAHSDFLCRDVFNKVSHPYKTTDKIMVLCVLNYYIFKWETGRQKFLN
jgi:hypothetical protein